MKNQLNIAKQVYQSKMEQYFSKLEEFKSYRDYPDSVKKAAARGIKLNEKNGNKCAEQTGKVRAQQLAKGEPISEDTIKRMYSFLSRAETYYDDADETVIADTLVFCFGAVSQR
jgi:MoxR-like ATPase